MGILYPPTQNGLQKQLNAQLDEAATTMTLNNVTGVQNKAGVCVVSRIDSDGELLSSAVREYITFTGTSGNTLTGLVRGLGGSTDQDHAIGSIVEFIPDILWAQAIIDALLAVVTTAGELDTTKVVDLTTAQTMTNKVLTAPTLTSPVLNTGLSGTAFLDEDTMSSDSATKVASQQSIKAYVDAMVGAVVVPTDGWTDGSAYTWTYASASTFTIAGVDLTAVFTKGTRLKFTQTTVKYAVVVASSFSTNTTVTIAVNTDYTIANAAISANYFSYQATPRGYPGTFAYTPTFSNFSLGNGTINLARFQVTGQFCKTELRVTLGNSSSVTGTLIDVAMPITMSSYGSPTLVTTIGTAFILDNGTKTFVGRPTPASTTNVALEVVNSSGTYATTSYTTSTVPMTWTTNDAFGMELLYLIA